MYAKVFRQMYDGTLATNGPWEALVTFQQMLVLANEEGVVDMTPSAIARTTTIPLNIIERGIGALSAPDPESRTPDEDGRRIVLLSENRNWGWRIVNYLKYRAIQKEMERRDYHRRYYHEKRKKTVEDVELNSISTGSTHSTDTEADTEAEEKTKTRAPRTASRSVCVSDLVAEGVNEQYAADWLKARGKIPLTMTAWNAVKREASKAGISASEAVKMAAEYSWRGFKADWVKTSNKSDIGRGAI